MSERRRWLISIVAASVLAFPSLAPARTARLWEPVEWKYTNPSCPGNPFDLVVKAVFTHTPSGNRITTELFHDGAGTHIWTLRFTGTRTGRWSFVTSSPDPDLSNLTGSVDVQPNPGAAGFLTTFDDGRKWGRLGHDEAFVPQYAMYKDPDVLHNNPGQIDADIATFFTGHGFNGFHVIVLCRWFDLHKTSYKDFATTHPNPDPRTFEALELLITKAHAAGGTVHLWAWGDEQRRMTPVGFDGGKNGPVDRRLQRYISARLGPLPGWSMGYGFDLQEWVSADDLQTWHTYMQDHLGWDHFLGGRSPDMTQIYDGHAGSAWFASSEQHRPDYDTYVKAIEQLHPGKPAFFTDRFRVRENVYPDKDYTVEMVRRGLWHSTMAGGAGNIWGYLIPDYPAAGGSHVFPNKNQVLTWSRFFRERFRKGMVRDNGLTDGTCLRLGNTLYVFHKEESRSVQMDLSRMNGPQPAVAVDAKKPYTEIDLGVLTPASRPWKAPYVSDWAIAVGRFDAPTRPRP